MLLQDINLNFKMKYFRPHPQKNNEFFLLSKFILFFLNSNLTKLEFCQLKHCWLDKWLVLLFRQN